MKNMILIDTNILYKFYGYHRNKRNNDNKYNLENLYSYLNKNCLKNKLGISMYSLMEVIVHNKDNFDYIMGIFQFISDKKIYISKTNQLDFETKEITDFLISDDIFQNDFIKKVFKRKKMVEINEFTQLYIPFLRKFTLVLGVFFSVNGQLDIKNSNMLIKLIYKYFYDNLNEIKEILNNNISIMIEDYYNEPDKNSNFGLNKVFNSTLSSFLFSCFHLITNFSQEINSIELKKLVQLQSFKNPLEYIRKVFKSVVEIPEYSSLKKDFIESYTKEFKNGNYPELVTKYYGNMLRNLMFSSNGIDKNNFMDINIIINLKLLQNSYHSKLFTFDKKLYDFIKRTEPNLVIDNINFLINI